MPLHITEYRNLGRDANGLMVLAGFEPCIAHQTETVTVGSTQSALLDKQTAFVMVHTTESVHIKFGINPTAVAADDQHLSAGETRFYAVQPNGTMKIALIQGA